MEKKEILKLLEPLLKDCNEDGFFLYDEAVENGEVSLEQSQEIELGTYTFIVHFGCSKIVLENEELPFVIKIPIKYFFYDSDIEEKIEMENILEEERKMWEKFPIQLKRLCLKNEKVGEIKGLPIYIQEKATGKDYSFARMPKDNSRRKMKNSLYKSRLPLPISGSDETVCALVYEDYGEKYVKQLVIFGLKDLHCANIGYIKDKIKIFDYGGFPIYSTSMEKLLRS